MAEEQAIAVVDLGGQYCHMIGRRLRDIGIDSQSFTHDVAPEALRRYAGIILSGGPDSVYDPNAPKINKRILKLGKPILGICYGHQLLAQLLRCDVVPGSSEFGKSSLHLRKRDSLFSETPSTQSVWMSHSDSVVKLRAGLESLAETDNCRIAAFGDRRGKYFGVQFHPEVAHTAFGWKVLENFGRKICKIATLEEPAVRIGSEEPAALIERLLKEIKDSVEERSVFFFVSGGVDSTVAFSLCARALPRDRVLGVYVDTGLMRKNETGELKEIFDDLGLADRFVILDRKAQFLSALQGIRDPEAKRRAIGKTFVDVQRSAMHEYGVDTDSWLLGQGTIYPDTVESGGAGPKTATIKTHHNRCDEIRKLIDAGRVIEPLKAFYKDQVREIGRALGLSSKIVDRWPFPGPGLAIRCLCVADNSDGSPQIHLPPEFADYEAAEFQISSVGVQGDARTYRNVAALRGELDYDRLGAISTLLCNTGQQFNRVIVQIAGTPAKLTSARRVKTNMTRGRIELLREADHITTVIVQAEGQANTVWQFPVVLIPIKFEGGECIILRPINSQDGMTANFARLKPSVRDQIGEAICQRLGIDAVFLDVTDKPPATIEWE